MGHCGRLVGRAPDVDEGDGGVEPVEDDEGHRRVAQEGPQQLAVELDTIQLYWKGIQSSAKGLSPGCVNTAGKARQMW